MVVTLRMNKRFMKFMRKEFPNLIKDAHPKFGMPVTPGTIWGAWRCVEALRDS